MYWIVIFILYLNYEICSELEDKNKQEGFEEQTDSDFERELEEDREFIKMMDLEIKKHDEISRRIRERVSKTIKEFDELIAEINNR